MIIYKHMAESTEDSTIFNAKIEVETDSLEEYMSALNALRTIGKTVDCDTVCHCNDIIKGVKGEFYPCKPDVFEQTYEEVSDA